jgi:hypothetical protein
MALPAVLIASLLLMVESQASDVADRSTLQGFLSKYMPSTSDASQRSMSDYDKFISPNINREKHGNGLDASSRTYWSPATDDRPVLRPASQGQDSMAITAARGKPSISAKDFDLPKIADREEKFFSAGCAEAACQRQQQSRIIVRHRHRIDLFWDDAWSQFAEMVEASHCPFQQWRTWT